MSKKYIISHSKYKNTGIIFELLVRTITSDTLKGKDSYAISLLKKYFVKTELGKEHKLYESLLKCKHLPESRANIFINTILESSKKLNRKILRKQKYNLIKEIKDNYNIETFFGAKINKYKVLASIYTLIENKNTQSYIDPNQIIDNKIFLLEYLTKKEVNKAEVKKDILDEFKDLDKDLRFLTYKIILETFNDSYQNFNYNQKLILREYINMVDSTPKLKSFYNIKINDVRIQLLKESKKIKNLVTKIKINEICKLLVELKSNCKFSNDNLVDLLQYYELLEEVKNANKV